MAPPALQGCASPLWSDCVLGPLPCNRLPAENRIVSLDVIGQRTKLNQDGVEFLLMKALSKHLMEGVIDQVDGTVSITWVQPKVLTLPQIIGLKDRLCGWISKVDQATVVLEEEAVGVE